MTVFTLHIFLMSLLRSERTRAAWVRRCANSSCELKKKKKRAAPIIARVAKTEQMWQYREIRGAPGPAENDNIMAAISVWIRSCRKSVPSLRSFIQFLCKQHFKAAYDLFIPRPLNTDIKYPYNVKNPL
jgi:hypothetical protein